MDQDDIDEFKQLLDLIYTELREFNTVVKEKLQEDEEGTPIVTVCPDCREEKLAKFSRKILEEPCYAC